MGTVRAEALGEVAESGVRSAVYSRRSVAFELSACLLAAGSAQDVQAAFAEARGELNRQDARVNAE